MLRLLSAFRTLVLFGAVFVAACLPGVATDWLFERGDGEHRTFHPDARSTTKPLEYLLPPLPGTPPSAEEYEAAPEQFDLRGNEIVRPVERYGVDRRGSLYELHSPHTEVPRLPPPEL